MCVCVCACVRLDSGVVVLCVRVCGILSFPFALIPPHAQACASKSQEPHQVGAALVQQGRLHCLGSGGSVSPPPPPRLSRVFACLDCPSRPRACVFAKIWLVWGCSRVCAGLGVDTRTRPRCPPVANACRICFWAVASCRRPLSLSAAFVFLVGGGNVNDPDDKSAPSRSRPT